MSTNEGTYTLTFEYVDPNNWNKVLARGIIKTIKVKQGKNAEQCHHSGIYCRG